MATPTLTVSPVTYPVSVNQPTNTVTVSTIATTVTVSTAGGGNRGVHTITSGTLDGGLYNTSTFNQITDLFIDGSTFDGGTP